jgi:hypothetical protein
MPASWDPTTPWDDTDLPALSRRAIAGLGLAIASILVAAVASGMLMLNGRPAERACSDATVVVGLSSIVLAVLSIGVSFRSRGGLWGLPFALLGAGIGAFAVYSAPVIYADLLADEEATARRLASGSNLIRINVALHDYEKVHGTLPPAAVYDKQGKPLLSWRVLVLPYLEREGEAERGLFQQFKLDEPWDSPHNHRLLERIPKVYAPPEGIVTPEPYTTYYQVFVGKGTAFEGTKGISLADFPDGTETTFLVVEAGAAVPWTKPEDLAYAPDQPLPELGGMSPHRFLVAMADGHVTQVRKEKPEETLRALITRNGGEPVPPDWDN